MSDDDNGAKLVLLAENDAKEVDKNVALDALRWPTRKAIGNLLRVMRGAGRPHNLADDIIELALAIQRAGQHTNAWYIGEAIGDVLHDAFRVACEKEGWTLATDEIVRGSLQRCASMMLHQNAQTSAGEREMISGVERLAQIRERNRLEREQPSSARSNRQARQPSRKPRLKANPVPAPRSVTIKSIKSTATASPAVPSEPEPTGRPMTTVEFMRARARELARER
jgi:hypothetical protein